jgi:hypothetical protein
VQDSPAHSLIDLSKLKQLAQNMLPHKSALRLLILSEPDWLHRDVLLVKLDVFLRLLYHELTSDDR